MSEKVKDLFLLFFRNEIVSTCRIRRADAENGILCFTAVRGSMAFLSGELAAAGALGIITYSEWEEFDRVLSMIEDEFYDMVR